MSDFIVEIIYYHQSSLTLWNNYITVGILLILAGRFECDISECNVIIIFIMSRCYVLRCECSHVSQAGKNTFGILDNTVPADIPVRLVPYFGFWMVLIAKEPDSVSKTSLLEPTWLRSQICRSTARIYPQSNGINIHLSTSHQNQLIHNNKASVPFYYVANR